MLNPEPFPQNPDTHPKPSTSKAQNKTPSDSYRQWRTDFRVLARTHVLLLVHGMLVHALDASDWMLETSRWASGQSKQHACIRTDLSLLGNQCFTSTNHFICIIQAHSCLCAVAECEFQLLLAFNEPTRCPDRQGRLA
jgi:hypothetical protein